MGAIADIIDEKIIYPVADFLGDVVGETPIIGGILEEITDFAHHEVYGTARDITDKIDEAIPDDLKMAAATVVAVAFPPLWFLPAVVAAANAADQTQEAGGSNSDILKAAVKTGGVALAASYAGGVAGEYVGTAAQGAGATAGSGAVAGAVVEKSGCRTRGCVCCCYFWTNWW